MPVYNAEKTLENAIRSVLRQRYSNLHLVIVDDASTDSSLEIAKKFLPDPRVSIYSNKKNMGAYYCRNYGLYAFKDRSWGYFTTHDADDISYENRYSSLIRFIEAKVNGIQDTFIRKRLDTNETISSSLTMAHAVFTKQVFKDIGYFDDTRFGGDWEHWERLKQFNKINRTKTVHHRQALGESFIHDQNLTVLIPVDSKKRKKYVETKTKEISRMVESKNFFRDFFASTTTSEIRFEGKRMSKPKEIAPRIAVIVLTWKRIGNIKNTLSELSKQTFKDFTVYISNGDLNKTNAVL